MKMTGMLVGNNLGKVQALFDSQRRPFSNNSVLSVS